MNVKLLNMKGENAGTLKVNDAVFGAEYNEPLIHQVIVAQRANARQGTKSALTRSEVRGHAKKPWRQKGTGHARQGSTKGPQWRGGGIVFAPKPRDFSKKVNKEAKRGAFVSAISAKVSGGDALFLDELNLTQAKTKLMQNVCENLKLDKRTLFVVAKQDETILRAAGNLENVYVTTADLLSVYDIVANAKLVLTKDAAKSIEEAYA